MLYVTSISELVEKTSFVDIPYDNLGAISEMKQVSNSVVYNKVTSKWDSVTKQEFDIAEATVYLPPFTKMAVITVDSNNTSLNNMKQHTNQMTACSIISHLSFIAEV